MPSPKIDRSVGLTIEGFDDLQSTLDRSTKDGAKKAIAKALRAGGRLMKAAIEERTPILDKKTAGSLPPGAMQSDIHVFGVKQTEARDHYEISVGPGKYTSFQAMLVEYGHASGHDKFTPEHSFLRIAWEITEEPAGELVQATLEAEMEKALAADGTVPDTGTDTEEVA